MPGVFPETQEAADAALYTHRAEQSATGTEIDVYAAWSLSEIVLGYEARLRAVDLQMHRLFEAGLNVVGSLWPNAVTPGSVTRLARWLEAGVERLGTWRARSEEHTSELQSRI